MDRMGLVKRLLGSCVDPREVIQRAHRGEYTLTADRLLAYNGVSLEESDLFGTRGAILHGFRELGMPLPINTVKESAYCVKALMNDRDPDMEMESNAKRRIKKGKKSHLEKEAEIPEAKLGIPLQEGEERALREVLLWSQEYGLFGRADEVKVRNTGGDIAIDIVERKTLNRKGRSPRGRVEGNAKLQAVLYGIMAEERAGIDPFWREAVTGKPYVEEQESPPIVERCIISNVDGKSDEPVWIGAIDQEVKSDERPGFGNPEWIEGCRTWRDIAKQYIVGVYRLVVLGEMVMPLVRTEPCRGCGYREACPEYHRKRLSLI